MSIDIFGLASTETLQSGRDVLYRAGLHQARYGWVGGQYGSYGTPRCAAGLVNSGTYELGGFKAPGVERAWATALIALANCTGGEEYLHAFGDSMALSYSHHASNAQGWMIGWNDQKGRTAADMMDAIVAAIELLNEEIAARLAFDTDEVVECPAEAPELESVPA